MGPKQANRLDLMVPMLKPEQMEAIKAMSFRGWETKVWAVGWGGMGWEQSVCGCVHSRFWNSDVVPLFPIDLILTPLFALHHTILLLPTFQVIDATWAAAEGPSGLVAALSRIAEEAAQAIDDGFDFVVLSDRAACGCRRPLPACCPLLIC